MHGRSVFYIPEELSYSSSKICLLISTTYSKGKLIYYVLNMNICICILFISIVKMFNPFAVIFRIMFFLLTYFLNEVGK